jgi:MYXO-CTERM domain-containing protein
MRRFVFTAAVLSSTALLPLACNVEEPDLPKEDVAKDDEAIIGGTADTTNKAVMFLYDENQGSACSGTMIAKNGSTGYILTAGHCNGMDIAIQADDVSDCNNPNDPGCEAVYQVTQDTPHPNWNGDPGDGYDFRILRVSGASNAPVIPAAQNPDGIGNGASIEAVGYGITPNNNDLRRHVTETVDQYDALLIIADQSDGTGSCSGDSGGPVLMNGTVVGVTSFGDQNCTQYGAYGRVQAVYATWIAGIIGAVVTPTCDDCFLDAQNNACSSRTDSCINNSDCTDLLDCFDGCSTNSCYQDCINAHPTGYNLYTALIDCACNACAVECDDECNGGSTTSTTSTSSGPGPAAATAQQSSSAAGTGGFGEGGSTGEGAADSTGSGTKKKKSDDDDDDDDETQTIDSCACATPGSSASGGMSGLLGLAGLGALAGVLVRRRRR